MDSVTFKSKYNKNADEGGNEQDIRGVLVSGWNRIGSGVGGNAGGQSRERDSKRLKCPLWTAQLVSAGGGALAAMLCDRLHDCGGHRMSLMSTSSLMSVLSCD